MAQSMVTGMPGIRAARTAYHRIVFRQGDWLSDLAGGKIIDARSRDPLNVGFESKLQAGLLMGRITATGKYAPSILGVSTVAYTSGGTSLTVGTQTAAELLRRVGASGTFKALGPPSANGTVATTTVTYSAINTGTGVLTVTDLGVNKVSGTFLAPTDGSETPVTLLPDGYPIDMFDDTSTAIDQPFKDFPIAGVIIAANILNWPTDTSLQAFIRTSLSTASGGKFVFDDQY